MGNDSSCRRATTSSSFRASYISCCWNLTDAAITALADRYPALAVVNMSNCKNLTNAVIIGPAERHPALAVGNMSNCKNLTDAAIIALAERCPALTQMIKSMWATIIATIR